MLRTASAFVVALGFAIVPLAGQSKPSYRTPDAGYVVKKVGKVTRWQLELESLNDAFPTITVPRDERTIVGTVVLRWCPHGARACRTSPCHTPVLFSCDRHEGGSP